MDQEIELCGSPKNMPLCVIPVLNSATCLEPPRWAGQFTPADSALGAKTFDTPVRVNTATRSHPSVTGRSAYLGFDLRPLLINIFAMIYISACGRVPETPAQFRARSAEQTSPPPKHSVYAVTWLSNDAPAILRPNEATEIKVSVKNSGDWVWPNPEAANPSDPDGRYAVRLCYRWIDEDGSSLPQGAGRSELRRPVAPGETANYAILVTSPLEPGKYRLQFDLVEELVTFFASRGAEPLQIPVVVE